MPYFITKTAPKTWRYIEVGGVPQPESLEDLNSYLLAHISENGEGPETTEGLLERGIVRGTADFYMNMLYNRGMVIYAGEQGSIPISECSEDFLRGLFQ